MDAAPRAIRCALATLYQIGQGAAHKDRLAGGPAGADQGAPGTGVGGVMGKSLREFAGVEAWRLRICRICSGLPPEHPARSAFLAPGNFLDGPDQMSSGRGP